MTDLLRCWRKGIETAALSLLLLGAAGCRHKPAPAAIPVAPPLPVPLEPVPEPKNPPLVASVPTQPIPLPRVTVPPPKKPKKVKKPTPPVQVATANVPVTPAATAPDPTSVIGALTPGGEQVPELHQRAVELIAANDKRLSGLSAESKEKQKEQLIRVQNFQKQAQTALAAGDADGAYTLATKAKVLLDDLQK